MTMTLPIHLLVYFVLLSCILFGSLAIDPRMRMHRMPPEIIHKVPARTKDETRKFAFVAFPLLLVMFGYPIIYLVQCHGDWWTNFFIMGAFYVGFNLWDTLLLDLWLFSTVTPKFILIPGTERSDYSNKAYHLRSGAKGMVISVCFSAVLAAFALLF